MAVSSQPRRVGEYICQLQATPAVPPCDCFPGRQNRGAHVRDIPMESAARKVQARPQGGRGPLCISSANQLRRCRELPLKEQPIETAVATCGRDAKRKSQHSKEHKGATTITATADKVKEATHVQDGQCRQGAIMRGSQSGQMGSIHFILNQTSPRARSYARCEASPSLILVSVNGGLLTDRLIPSGQGGIWWRRRYGPVRGRGISNSSGGPRPRSLRCQEELLGLGKLTVRGP